MRLRILVLTLIACAWLGTAVAHADSPSLNALATHLAHSPVTVQCFPHNDDETVVGYVDLNDDPTVIHLDGSLCGSLENVLHPGPRTPHWAHSFDGSMAVGYAFLALLHEATHIREYNEQGVDVAIDEGATECSAYKNVWPALKVLHLSWQTRERVYDGAKYFHLAKPTRGLYSVYRSVC